MPKIDGEDVAGWLNWLTDYSIGKPDVIDEIINDLGVLVVLSTTSHELPAALSKQFVDVGQRLTTNVGQLIDITYVTAVQLFPLLETIEDAMQDAEVDNAEEPTSTIVPFEALAKVAFVARTIRSFIESGMAPSEWLNKPTVQVGTHTGPPTQFAQWLSGYTDLLDQQLDTMRRDAQDTSE